MPSCGIRCAVVIGCLSALPCRAGAIIRVDIPVSKIYEASHTVVTGTVATVNPARRVVVIVVGEVLKGRHVAGRLRVQLLNPAELIEKVAKDAPAVVFAGQNDGKPVAVVHLADTWLLAEGIAGADPPAWRVGQVHDIRQSFPGRTGALIKVVQGIKAGKGVLLDKIESDSFREGAKLLARLDVPRPRWLLADDVNADKRVDLLVGTAEGARLFLAGGAGYAEATKAWGLSGAGGQGQAFGDANADGKTDLLLGGRLWINTGVKFVAADAGLRLPEGRLLAAAMADVTADGRPDAVFLVANGQLRVYENSAAPDKPWKAHPPKTLWRNVTPPAAAMFGDFGDTGRPHVIALHAAGCVRYALDPAGGPPADHEQLTGKRLGACHRALRAGLKNVLATALDVNADGRRDVFVIADGGALILVNRGLGSFLVDPAATDRITGRGERRTPFKLAPPTVWTAADLHGHGFEDLLILTSSGELYKVANRSSPRPAR